MSTNPRPHARQPRPPRNLRGNRAAAVLSIALALAACNRAAREPASAPQGPATPDAAALNRVTPASPVDASQGPTGAVEGIVTITAPIPPARPIHLDESTARRRGCREAAQGYYANPFGVTEPGPMPEAVVTVDARTTVRPPPRRRNAVFHECSIEPRILAMALGDDLFMRSETGEYHLPKVDGLGSTIAQMIQRGEDQQKFVQRPGRYIIHSVNFPNWMQTPLVVTPNPFYDQTDRQGHYRIENLPPGTWTMHAWFPNTTPVDATVTVRAGETVTQNFSITPLPAEQIRPNQPETVDAGAVIP